MSRWHDLYLSHPFRAAWQQVLSLSQVLSVQDETIKTNVEEVARLRKVVTYLNELIEAVDPELVPLSTWDISNDQINSCLSQINAFISNQNISHIQNANAHLDNLLSYIKPYVVNAKSAAIAAGKAFKEYSDSVEFHISQLQQKAKSAIEATQNYKQQAEQIIEYLENSKERIHSLEEKLFDGSDEEDSLEDRADELIDEIEKSNEVINEYLTKLKSGDEKEGGIILQIETAKKNAQENAETISSAVSDTQDTIDELESFYEKIFGAENDEGVRSGGLNDELTKRRKELDEFKQQHEKTYTSLLLEIEKLMPGAVSAGLASAYGEMKKSFDKTISTYTTLFYATLIILALFSIISAIETIDGMGIHFVKFTTWPVFVMAVLHHLPIIGPAVWLVLFSSKRRSEAMRLQQEYAHKEALAKSYQNFKKQIEDLNLEDKSLMSKLLDASISAIAFNASSTLDGKHGDKTPVHEFLGDACDKVSTTLDKANQFIDSIKR